MYLVSFALMETTFDFLIITPVDDGRKMFYLCLFMLGDHEVPNLF